MDDLEELEATQVLSGGEDEPEVGVAVGVSGEEGDRERGESGESGACERESRDRGESEMDERQTALNVGKESSKAVRARERQRLELMRENQRLIRENQSIDVGFSGRRRFKNPAEVAALLKQKQRSCGIVGSGGAVPGPVARPVVDMDGDENTCGGDVPPLRQRLEIGGRQDLLPPPRPAIHDPQLPREQKSKLTLDQFLRQKIGSGQDQQFVELQPSAAIKAQKDAVQQLRDRLKRSLMHRYLPTGPHKQSSSQPAEVRCVRTAGEIDPILSRGVELILGDEERARFTDMTPRDKWNRHRQLVLAAARQKNAVAREAQLEILEAELADTEQEDGEQGDNRDRDADDDPEWTAEGAARGSGGDASDSGDSDTASDSDSDTDTDSGSGDSGSDRGEGGHTRQSDGDRSGSEEDSFGDVTKKPVPARMKIESDSDSCGETGSGAVPDHGAVALPPAEISAGGGESSSLGAETAVTVAHEVAVSELSVKVSLNDTGSDLFPDFNNSGNWRDLSSTGTVSMSSVIADKSGSSRSLSASVVSGEMRLNHRHMFDFSSVQGHHNASIDDKEENSVTGHGSLLADTVDIDDYESVDEARDVGENKDEEAEEEQEEEEGEEEEEELVDEDEEEDQRQRLAAARDMFDEEAELSGSDADQYEDEDETGMDGLDGDEEDLDQEKLPSAGRLRRQIERVHNRLELDRDARDIRYLQELYLEDGELHEFGDQPRRRAWFNDGNNNEGNDKFSEYQVRYRDLYDDKAGDDDADADESAAIGQDASDDTAVPIEAEEDQLKENNSNSININYCKSAPAVSSVAANMTLEEYMKKLKSEKRSIKRVSLIGKNLPDVSKQLAETCGTSGGFQTLRSRVEQRLFTVIPRSKANSDATARKRDSDHAGGTATVAERQSGPSAKRVRPDNAQRY